MLLAARQTSIFDICSANHGNQENSVAAHKRTNADADRRKILAFIQAQGSHGATCAEIEEALNMLHQTCSARCSDLKAKRLVEVAGTRKTKTGSAASVLVAAQIIKHWPEE